MIEDSRIVTNKPVEIFSKGYTFLVVLVVIICFFGQIIPLLFSTHELFYLTQQDRIPWFALTILMCIYIAFGLRLWFVKSIPPFGTVESKRFMVTCVIYGSILLFVFLYTCMFVWFDNDKESIFVRCYTIFLGLLFILAIFFIVKTWKHQQRLQRIAQVRNNSARRSRKSTYQPGVITSDILENGGLPQVQNPLHQQVDMTSKFKNARILDTEEYEEKQRQQVIDRQNAVIDSIVKNHITRKEY
ncbi:hypothetical protein PCE1_003754 [Barthelona sp. PCE]